MNPYTTFFGRAGFTATRHVDGREADILEFVDRTTDDCTEFTTGACWGGDSLIARHLLSTRADAAHRLIVPQKRDQVDTDMFHHFLTHTGGWASIELMQAGSNYRDRNNRILDHTDRLLAVAEYPEDHGKSRRSGTWMTVRLARKRGIPFVVYILNKP